MIHTFASLRLGELRETRKEPLNCKTCLRHAAPGGRQHVARQLLELLPLPADRCWTKRASAGTYSRGGGLAAARFGEVRAWEKQ